MEAAAERACRHIGYHNAGTVEFLVGPDGTFSFIEMNTRLQVEHPVTELVTGIDLVASSCGSRRASRSPHGGRAGVRRGHAIEVRINAEDPARGFAPRRDRSTGSGRHGPGVRVDTPRCTPGLSGAALLRLADRQADRRATAIAASRSSARGAR